LKCALALTRSPSSWSSASRDRACSAIVARSVLHRLHARRAIGRDPLGGLRSPRHERIGRPNHPIDEADARGLAASMAGREEQIHGVT